MALGTNLKFAPDSNILWAKIKKVLLQKPLARSNHATTRKWMCTKAGAPATNTAADDPGHVGVFCLDVTNSDVYLCTAYTNSTTFTWVNLTP